MELGMHKQNKSGSVVKADMGMGANSDSKYA